jgi:hypothetical protein
MDGLPNRESSAMDIPNRITRRSGNDAQPGWESDSIARLDLGDE